ncbi:hypothetical protein ENBRE01_0591 [Enteropsectra breve]|nr:hypothetical protein ENBRE01_0591 [Enteropsectra breve]
MKSEGHVPSSRRDENSLYSLTKKFVTMISKTPDKKINMKHAAELLNVHKRRIYDITNVLEGLNMVSKWSVNSVKWMGDFDEALDSDYDDDDMSLEVLKIKCDEEKELDKELAELNAEIADLSCNQQNLDNAYITYDDLQNLEIFKNKLVFAVKAPIDTAIEFPKYEKGSYKLKLITEKGQVSVYYVNNDK